MLLTILTLWQQGLRATQPTYFFPVAIFLLVAGGVGWLIAAVLGFARAPAFGPSARWFSYAAVCLIIYHLHFVLILLVAFVGATQNYTDFGAVLSVGAFFNLFIVLGAICAIMGFVRMTTPR